MHCSGHLTQQLQLLPSRYVCALGMFEDISMLQSVQMHAVGTVLDEAICDSIHPDA